MGLGKLQCTAKWRRKVLDLTLYLYWSVILLNATITQLNLNYLSLLFLTIFYYCSCLQIILFLTKLICNTMLNHQGYPYLSKFNLPAERSEKGYIYLPLSFFKGYLDVYLEKWNKRKRQILTSKSIVKSNCNTCNLHS